MHDAIREHMRAPITITLGGRDFEIRPLVFRQVKAAETILNDARLGVLTEIEASGRVVKIALERDHADDAARFDDLEMTGGEVVDAAMALIVFAGFRMKDAAPGEATAVSIAPRSGAASEAA